MRKLEHHITEFVVQKKPIQFKTFSAGPEFINKVHTGLNIILNYKDYEHLSSALIFILRELITNANKANMKRAFFTINEIDINNKLHYEMGIKEFSQRLRKEYTKLEEHLKSCSMHTRVIFKEYADEHFVLYIINNVTATPEEIHRVNEKISNYKKSKTDPNIILNLVDETEGAGMGLFLSLQLLEKVGITCDSFKFGVNNEVTFSKISFSYINVTPPPYNLFTKLLLDEVDKLPEFPSHMKKILSMLEDDGLDLKDLARQIQIDPSLSAELLKYVNSSGVVTNRKIGTIKEAINFTGVKKIRAIVYSHSAMSIVNSKFGNIKDIWTHSYRTGIIAERIAAHKKFKNKYGEYYTAGLLHDIGKIILIAVDTEKAKKIEKICREKKLDLPVIEELTVGISHAAIGGKIAKHWDFPDPLVNAITYHHNTMMSVPDKPLVYTIYLANYFDNIEKGVLPDLLSIDVNVQKFFELETEQDLLELYNKVLK